MKLYLDSSALVKLVQRETESTALRRYLRGYQGDLRVTSALARTEVVRAVWGGGPAAVAHARRVLSRVHQVDVSRAVLDDAAVLAPGTILRSLDALHIATASVLGADLRALITYDGRMATAAAGLGMTVRVPT